MLTKSLAVLIALGLGTGAALAQSNPKLMVPAVSAAQAKGYTIEQKADLTKVAGQVVKVNDDTSRSLGQLPDAKKMILPNFNVAR
jgi:hypothetical protein